MGCSGKSQQHRLLPPSFPPTSSLSTPYSFTSIFHPSRYSLITFFSSFINQVSVLLLFSELNLPSPRPISMPIPPLVINAKPTHINIHGGKRPSENYNPLPQNSNHGIAPQFAVETKCSRLLVCSLNRCRDRFPAIPPNDIREDQGPCNRHDRHDRPNLWGL